MGKRSLSTGVKSTRSTGVSKIRRRTPATAKTPRPNARIGHLTSWKPSQTRTAPSAAQATETQLPLNCKGAATVRNTVAMAKANRATSGGVPVRLIAA